MQNYPTSCEANKKMGRPAKDGPNPGEGFQG